MSKKKRKIKIFRLLIVLLIPVLIVGCVLIYLNTRPASIHEDALKYKNKGCVIFYPDNERIKEYAVNYCANSEKQVVDYVLSDFGEFTKVSYGLDYFIVTKDYKEIEFEIANKEILANEFRYEYRKSENDEAYTSKFLRETNSNNFNSDGIKVSLEDSGVNFHFDNYDFDLLMSFPLAQQVLDVDFGFENIAYEKRSYVSPNRPKVAITYDDGPYRYVDDELFELFAELDSRCTFYIVGNRLSEAELNSVKKGIDLGMEYGSHTYSHSYLNKYDTQFGIDEVMHPYKMLDENFGYKMKTFRFPGGNINSEVENSVPLESVLWSVDTLDWKYRDADYVYSRLMEDTKDGSIVLMHCLYETSKQASKRAIPELIDKGFQLVSVSELLNLD